MEPAIETIVFFSPLLVPMLALWAIAALYSQCTGAECQATQFLYFGTLLVVSFVTLRTIANNEGCWLVHTSTLGVLIVAGVMRRPAAAQPRIDSVFGA